MRMHYPGMDVVKYVASLFIISIHFPLITGRGPAAVYLNEAARFAVPFFFLASAFLFWARVCDEPEEGRRSATKSFAKRVALLLAFWWVANIPFIWMHYLQGRGWAGIHEYRDMVARGTPWLAGWFFVALLVAVPVVVLARRHMSAGLLVAATLPLFAAGVLSSADRGYLSPGAQSFVAHFSASFFVPYAGPLTGVFWVALGFWAAERRAWLERTPLVVWVLLLVLSVAAGAYECAHLIKPAHGGPRDQYASLVLIAPAIFLLALRWRWSIPGAVFLRNASTVNFGAQFVLGAWFFGRVLDLHLSGLTRGIAIAVAAGGLTLLLGQLRRVPGVIGRVAGYAY